MPVEVKIRKSEPIERALRRLKKKIEREDIITVFRENRYFKKPSAIRRQKEKEAKFKNMLRERYANM